MTHKRHAVRCQPCEGSGFVGIITGHSQLFEGLCGVPMSVTATRAREILGDHGILRLFVDKVTDVECPDCGGSGILCHITQIDHRLAV